MLFKQTEPALIWARCTTCAGALREWANIVTAACSSAVRSRKQTRAMSDLRQKAVIIPLNMPDEPLIPARL
jgi:hypothetical protein